MIVAVIGGTGKMGGALALRLAGGNEVIVGSRDRARAEEAAKAIPGARGADYSAASREAEVVVVAIPNSAVEEMAPLADELSGKLVISVVNPLRFDRGLFYSARDGESAAEELARILPKSRVATAFNNIPSALLERDDVPVDVLVAADSKEIYEEVAALVSTIPKLRPLYAGPLTQARVVESITALVLNLAKLNRTGSLATKFVSGKG